MEESSQKNVAVLVVITCAHCGATLREQFDRGVMICDRCDREIPVADVLAALGTLGEGLDPRERRRRPV